MYALTVKQRIYCTFFDVGYLAKGITMIQSVRQNGDNSQFYILALDDEVENFLKNSQISGISVIRINQIEKEFPQLLEVKPVRTSMEYYFTCTPYLFLYLFKTVPGVTMAAYLDADLFFFSDPSQVFSELGDNSVGVTEHRYSIKNIKRLGKYGKFNAGFLVFKNDMQGNEVLRWWSQQTLEWCSDKPNDGKYANQGYLNDFPSFSGVHSFQSAGFNLAPWNSSGVKIKLNDRNQVQVDGDLLCFFHFHGFRITRSRAITSEIVYGGKLTSNLRNYIYQPYLFELEKNTVSISRSVILNQQAFRGNGIHGFVSRFFKKIIDWTTVITGNSLSRNFKS